MAVQPFRVDIPQAKLDDLMRRLGGVNWPHDFDNDDWGYGVPTAYLRELVEYWRSDFDWRAQEKEINAHSHFRAQVDGLPIHFIHERGRGPNPMPLLLTHGWPWTFWDLRYVIGPLVDPAAHGGDPADAFDVVVPSLPGYIFSTPLERAGVSWATTADLWVELMCNVLGYERFAAQGGDWGALVTAQLGHKWADKLHGIHLTNAFRVPAFGNDRPWSLASGSLARSDRPEDAARQESWERRFAAHVATHMLHAQTIATALHDSPVGLAAWMVEKRRDWGDCRGDVESRFTRDHLLTTFSLYWLTDSFVTSVRFYAEAARVDWKPAHDGKAVQTPTGFSLFEHDLPPGSLEWLDDHYDVRLRKTYDDGGHFAPAENPDAIVEDLRELFRPLRG